MSEAGPRAGTRTGSSPLPVDAAPVRAGEDLDWPSVERYLRREMPELKGDFEVLQLPNGSANLTYLLRFGATAVVLRRPPFGRIAPGAHDMEREYRALSQLWRAFPPAPRALLFCADTDVVGAKFFVMEYRAGAVIWGSIPAAMSGHVDVGRRIGLAVVRALAELHRLDPDACGLGDLGRPEGFVARQVSGWRRRWDLVAPPGSDGALPAMHEAAELLDRTQPVSQRAAIVHNDPKLDNCQFDPADPDHVRSMFDWDMATLGDPLVDVGTLLNYSPDPSDLGADRGVYIPGMESMGLPTHDEMAAEYAACSGLDVNGIGWYEAFACWKTAVVLQQLYDRYRRGESSDPRMAIKAERVPDLARRTLRLLGAAAPPS